MQISHTGRKEREAKEREKCGYFFRSSKARSLGIQCQLTTAWWKAGSFIGSIRKFIVPGRASERKNKLKK